MFLVCATSWSQTIYGTYTINPLKGIGDKVELSEMSKIPLSFSYIYSNKVSLQELQSFDLDSIGTSYIEHEGQIVQVHDTVYRASKVIVYKNHNTDIYRLDYAQKHKKYSIEDKISKYQWTLVEGNKTIAGYSCKKATTTNTKVGRQQNLVAWYSEEIPIDDGMNDYNGLPGLILQVEIDNLTRITFEKIDIDPNGNIDIPVPPKTTNSLSIKEYEAMMMSKP